MYDPTFTLANLKAEVRRVDFLNFPRLRAEGALEHCVQLAYQYASVPGRLAPYIAYGNSRGKLLSRASDYPANLVLRKLNRNLLALAPNNQGSREAAVASLRLALSENVPYRLYKLDVRHCYESFSQSTIESWLTYNCVRFGAVTERMVRELLARHTQCGGTGLPRGLAISSTLANGLLSSFDSAVSTREEVFFYKRYVDDIVLLTSSREQEADLLRFLSSQLPDGLVFSKKVEKRSIFTAGVLSKGAQANPQFKQFDFLGYDFEVGVACVQATGQRQRPVRVDIAKKKAARLKSRLIRSLLSFLEDRDFSLLDARLRHLTSNLSMVDRSSGLRRLVGIHFNYPQIDLRESRTLEELDRFLKNAIYSAKGRVYGRLAGRLSLRQKETLSRHSFKLGARNKRFFQLNLQALGRVQKCWKYVR